MLQIWTFFSQGPHLELRHSYHSVSQSAHQNHKSAFWWSLTVNQYAFYSICSLDHWMTCSYKFLLCFSMVVVCTMKRMSMNLYCILLLPVCLKICLCFFLYYNFGFAYVSFRHYDFVFACIVKLTRRIWICHYHLFHIKSFNLSWTLLLTTLLLAFDTTII